MRLKLILAYDGRGFGGWQSQAGGNTVQDQLERALAETAKKPVKRAAASHAKRKRA